MKTRKVRTGSLALLVLCGLMVYTFTATGGYTEKPKPALRLPTTSIGPWLWLSIEGNFIEGESTTPSFERENTIECCGLKHAVAGLQASAKPVGVTHSPVTIVKRVDKASPLLYKALCENERVDYAEFRFFRPTSTGGEEHYLTILLEEAAIVDIKKTVHMDGIIMQDLDLQYVSFTFRRITWKYETTGVEYTHDLTRP